MLSMGTESCLLLSGNIVVVLFWAMLDVGPKQTSPPECIDGIQVLSFRLTPNATLATMSVGAIPCIHLSDT
jgi:hypothetical protein